MSHRLRVFDDPTALASAAADEIARLAREAVAARGRFSVAVAGGSTPRATYQELATRDVPWEMTTVVFGDERGVSPEDPQSNWRMAKESLLSRLPAGRGPRALRIEGEWVTRDAAAEDYAEALARAVPGTPPVLDLALLGVGTDGHTASLFPGSPLFAEDESRLVAAVWHEASRMWRITLTPRVLRAARERLFLVVGEDKAAAVERALTPGSDLPAAAVGDATWYLAPSAAFRDLA